MAFKTLLAIRWRQQSGAQSGAPAQSGISIRPPCFCECLPLQMHGPCSPCRGGCVGGARHGAVLAGGPAPSAAAVPPTSPSAAGCPRRQRWCRCPRCLCRAKPPASERRRGRSSVIAVAWGSLPGLGSCCWDGRRRRQSFHWNPETVVLTAAAQKLCRRGGPPPPPACAATGAESRPMQHPHRQKRSHPGCCGGG